MTLRTEPGRRYDAAMHVVLLRHGIAMERGDPTCPTDDLRPLSFKGRRRTAGACRGLAAMDVLPERIYTSPLTRAQQTAQIAAEQFGRPRILTTDVLRGGTHPGLLFELLGSLTVGEVLCVGHAPHLDLVLAQALRSGQASIEKLKKAGAARIAFDSVAAGSGRLEWQLQPRALRALGKATEGDPA